MLLPFQTELTLKPNTKSKLCQSDSLRVFERACYKHVPTRLRHEHRFNTSINNLVTYEFPTLAKKTYSQTLTAYRYITHVQQPLHDILYNPAALRVHNLIVDRWLQTVRCDHKRLNMRHSLCRKCTLASGCFTHDFEVEDSLSGLWTILNDSNMLMRY